MTAWADRSPEVAALLNPAFCGVLLYSAVNDFVKRGKRPMPFEQAFLILPFVLHTPTREILPRNTNTLFQSWVNGEPVIQIGLGERVRAASPTTRESLMYMISRKCLVFDIAGLVGGSHKPKMSSKTIMSSDEIRPLVQAGASVGRLLAAAGTSATVFTTLGISP